VGVKSAQRMAFHLLQHDRDGARRPGAALRTRCSACATAQRCHTFTEGRGLRTCLDPRRDARLLCVVETPADQAALERSGSYRACTSC
jgi:recombination protein RecR